MENELDGETQKSFAKTLTEKGLNAENYYYLPVHEWQWKNVIIQNFTDDLAKGLIVALEMVLINICRNNPSGHLLMYRIRINTTSSCR